MLGFEREAGEGYLTGMSRWGPKNCSREGAELFAAVVLAAIAKRYTTGYVRLLCSVEKIYSNFVVVSS